MFRLFFSLLLTTLLVTRAQADEASETPQIERLVFFDVDVTDSIPETKAETKALTQVLGDALLKLPVVDVIDREKRDELLLLWNHRLKECASPECRLAMVKTLEGIDWVVQTVITPTHLSCSLHMQIKSLHTGLTVNSNIERVECDLFALIAAIGRSTNLIWPPLIAREHAPGQITAPGAYRIELHPPDSELKLNGKKMKTTSGIFAAKGVAAQDYAIEVSRKNYISKREVVIVQPGVTTYKVIRLELLPARLSIQTRPAGAVVLLNNKEAGLSPLTLDLAPGRYELETTLQDFESSKFNLVLKPNKTKALSIKLATWHSYRWYVLRYGGFAIGTAGLVTGLIGSVGAPHARRSYDGSRDIGSSVSNRNKVMELNRAIVMGWSAFGAGSTMFLTTFFIQ